MSALTNTCEPPSAPNPLTDRAAGDGAHPHGQCASTVKNPPKKGQKRERGRHVRTAGPAIPQSHGAGRNKASSTAQHRLG